MGYILSIEGMTCAACAGRIEKKLNQLENIENANVNPATKKAVIASNEKLDLKEIDKLVENLGYEAVKEKVEIDIDGMTCSACSSRIEKQVGKMDGVLSSNVNLTTKKGTFLILKGVQSEKSIIQKIQKLGYDGKAARSGALKDNDEALRNRRFKLIVSAVLSLPLLLSMFDMMFGFSHIPDIFSNKYFQFIFATLVQFYCGWQFYKGAWANISHFSANMDVLGCYGNQCRLLF